MNARKTSLTVMSYVIAIGLMFSFSFLSKGYRLGGSFASALPWIMPMVFGLVAAAVAPLFSIDKSKGHLIQTAISSLSAGLSSFVFGFVAFYLEAPAPCYAAFLAMGILFLVLGVVRLFVKGALSAYRKSKNF
ncbi:hypothetical protein PQ610_07045 [Tardisphaera miroshnichenkoae]